MSNTIPSWWLVSWDLMWPIGGELVTTITSPSCWGTHFLYLSNPPSGNLLPIIPCACAFRFRYSAWIQVRHLQTNNGFLFILNKSEISNIISVNLAAAPLECELSGGCIGHKITQWRRSSPFQMTYLMLFLSFMYPHWFLFMQLKMTWNGHVVLIEIVCFWPLK